MKMDTQIIECLHSSPLKPSQYAYVWDNLWHTKDWRSSQAISKLLCQLLYLLLISSNGLVKIDCIWNLWKTVTTNNYSIIFYTLKVNKYTF
jgi:hypothetical protein